MLIPLADQATDLGAEVGVFGGSGFYEFLDDCTEIEIATPYGPPASPVSVGTLAGRRVAFIARHGRHHDYAAHRVPYRANVWALASVGVRSIIAPCSVGSLQPDLHPGDLVVVDQIIDRTKDRADTFHDVGSGDGLPGSDGAVHHQTFAEPYAAELRSILLDAARSLDGCAVHDGGTMVVINGPRFSTRAESLWFRQMGWHVVNMTGYPEAVLAAEANIPYAAVALVTDYDAGVDGHEPGHDGRGVRDDAAQRGQRARADHHRAARAAVARRDAGRVRSTAAPIAFIAPRPAGTAAGRSPDRRPSRTASRARSRDATLALNRGDHHAHRRENAASPRRPSMDPLGRVRRAGHRGRRRDARLHRRASRPNAVPGAPPARCGWRWATSPAGQPVRATAAEVPTALVPPGAVTEPPGDAVARQRVTAGEIVVAADLAAAPGPAALADPDTVVVGLTDPLARNVAIGLHVQVAAEGVVLAETARSSG